MNMIDGLSKHNKVYVAIKYFGEKPALKTPNDNVEFIEIGSKSAYEEKVKLFRGFSKDLEKIVLEKEIDVIHSNHYFITGEVALRLAKKHGKPFVITNHQFPAYYTICCATVVNFFLKKHLARLDNGADRVIAPSQTIASLLEGIGVKKDKIKVISNGINIKLFVPGDREAAKKELGLPQKPIVLFVGRFAEEKRIDLLAKAAPNILERMDAQFVLAGFRSAVSKLDKFDELFKLINRIGVKKNFTYLGHFSPFSDKLVKAYQAADVFVLPSDFETQGIVLMEAMACGAAAVASSAGALPELVQNGKNGYLFKKGDYKDLSGKIISVLGDPEKQEQMGNKSRELIMAHGLEKTVAEYEKIYKSLIV
ncbi:hypothetical protein CO123_03030 [bacterium (Candidatus Howlettbacteria) CG_4_9_14_3_um_filter_37_10]|nr:MAG: hypothetical protein CO123_03030 [bacterium (Candidatus Howlettbacteria) CG_4_9_14_3_um_filter_37_10]